MASDLKKYDKWLSGDGEGVIALRYKQVLTSAEDDGNGSRVLVFPPTFAPSSKTEGSNYCISGEGEKSSCIIDTIASQANRIEPLFENEAYSALVPQINIRCKDDVVNILRAPHRAGDAFVRFSNIGEKLWQALLKVVSSNNYEDLAKIAPTSILFGMWDSRGTQVKVRRIFSAMVDAYNISSRYRSAQYVPPVDYIGKKIIDDKYGKGGDESSPMAQEGFASVPAVNANGGVFVNGSIIRDYLVNISQVRKLLASSPARTLSLRRYIFSLALVSLTVQNDEKYDLREGCMLRCLAPNKEVFVVHREGADDKVVITADDAKKFAEAAAADFGVGDNIDTEFNEKLTDEWLGINDKARKAVRRTQPMTDKAVKVAKTTKAPKE